MDNILRSLFLDINLWSEVIEHGIKKGIPDEYLEYIQDPNKRAELCMQIGSGSYFIEPPHTGYRPKEDGGERTFFINTPMDRLVLFAIYKWLTRNEGEMIHPRCLSYQEGIGIGKIVKELSWRIKKNEGIGTSNIVGRKFDIHKYFDTVKREHIARALDTIEEHHGKSSVIELLRRYYNSDVYYDSRSKKMTSRYQGIKQGCAVSSWLANVILYDLDKEISTLNGCYVRYSDDIIYIGKDYEAATEKITDILAEKGLEINPKKIEEITGDKFSKFLGYNIRGAEITLSKKWVKHFQAEIDKRTIKDTGLIKRVRAARRLNNKEEREAELMRCLRSAQLRIANYLYKGDGKHSWATLVLSTINRDSDIKELNLYCLDALRAVYTGKTSIGGLGATKENGIKRGRGRNVAHNRLATEHLAGNKTNSGAFSGFCSISAAKKSLPNKWLYRTIVNDLLGAENRLYSSKNSTRLPNDEAIAKIEELYTAHLNSRPGGKREERFYAKGLSEMTTADLLRGHRRSQTLKELEQFIEESVNFETLTKDPAKWYWQSNNIPELVILKKWFE